MITLRELTAADLPLLNKWRADREIADGLGGAFRHVNVETDQAWFQDYLGSRSRNVRMGIVLDETHELIGVAYLLDIEPIHRRCEFAVMVGAKEHWGKGYGTAAVRSALDHAFADLNLTRVYLYVNCTNDAALRLYEKTGFRREGILRKHAYKSGEYLDVAVMGMLRDEWKGLASQDA